MSNAYTAPARNGSAPASPVLDGRPAAEAVPAPRTVNWSGYPALFQRVSTMPRTPERLEPAAAAIPLLSRTGGVREAFLGFCQAALSPGAGPECDSAATRALAAAERFGFTRDDIRRLGCGLYPSPAHVREHLRAVGFNDAEIDAARLASDDDRPRSELAGCLVVPLADETGFLCDFLFLSPGEPSFRGYRFLEGPPRAGAVAYGLSTALARPAARESLVLVDDVLECLLLQCRGIPNVIAVGGCGHEFSPRRWEELARLGVASVTLAFRRDDRYAGSVRDALVSALRARTAPQVFVANPYPGGERSAADVLRRFGRDTCAVALAARSLAFHDKDFGAEPRNRPIPAAPRPPQEPASSREPHYRSAYRDHLVELAAALPYDERHHAEQTIIAVEAAVLVGELARAERLVEAAVSGWTQVPIEAHALPCLTGDFTSTVVFVAAPQPELPPRWFAPLADRVAPRGPLCSDESRNLLLALRDWLRREREAARP